ncbi:MAG: hypothetical protein ACE5JS_09180 [Nitrospinota bacterium]
MDLPAAERRGWIVRRSDVLLQVEGRNVGIEVIGKISRPETIAVGRGIRELDRLRRVYGPGRWRKRKGVASVRLPDGTICTAEVHWYEAHGIGRKEFKVKKILSEQP